MGSRISGFVAALWFAAAAAAQPQLPADYAERVAALEQAHKNDPRNLKILDALAGSYAMGGRYKEAIAAVKEMAAIEKPDRALTYRLAQFYAWNGEPDRSLEELRRLDLRRDPEAAEFECEVLAGARRPLQAERCYRSVLDIHGLTAAQRNLALLGRARNALWSGNWSAGARAYAEVLRSDPANETATKEYINLLRYKGDYGKAEKLCDGLLGNHPKDAELLALRAELLFWAGHRSSQALRDARRALDASPGLPEARLAYIAALESLGLNQAATLQLEAFHDEQAETPDSGSAPANHAMESFLESRLRDDDSVRSDSSYSEYNDSDGIHDATYQTALAIPVARDHSLGLKLGDFVSSAPSGGIFTAGRDRASIRDFSVSGAFLLAPGLNFSAQGGGSTRLGADSLRPTYRLTLSKFSWDRWFLSFGTGRDFLTVTPRAIDQNISSIGVFGEARYFFDSRTSLDLNAGRRWWSDTNRSLDGAAAFSHTAVYGKRFNLDGGALGGYQSFNLNLIAVSGFFTPDRYVHWAGFMDGHGEAGPATWEVRGEGGAQQVAIAAPYEPAWNLTARLSLKLGRDARLSGWYERRNYSLIDRNGWYQGFYAGLGIRF